MNNNTRAERSITELKQLLRISYHAIGIEKSEQDLNAMIHQELEVMREVAIRMKLASALGIPLSILYAESEIEGRDNDCEDGGDNDQHPKT